MIDRAYGIAGAQPTELIASALHRAWTDSHPLQMLPVGGDAGVECTDQSCDV